MLDNGHGISQSYGFAPDEDHHGQPFAQGRLYDDDDANYQTRTYINTIEITDAQYASIVAFAASPAVYGFDLQYNGLNNSCIDFVWKALEVAGLNPSGFEGQIWPTLNSLQVEMIRNGFANGDDSLLGSLTFPAFDLPFGIYDFFKQLGLALGMIDPLILDFDGDGIQTINPDDSTAYFDFDGGGSRTHTGWISTGDGFLVLDRNHNGAIDSGAEMLAILRSG